ncbi:hypothetical protein Tcan_05000 [Toxocara canis]|uniref:Uncharacterized protein n=1 Tax=Toxocara canis TaxID=6265 RepID=A0A0B2VHX0_TOXCA|nr:hypothetical protein Tcan_05000 [Toxocara canis]
MIYSKSRSTHREEQINIADFNKLIVQAIVDHELVREKSLRAVIKDPPEDDTDESTADADLQLVRNWAAKIGIADALVPGQLPCHGLRRHGRARILKVPFTDIFSPDQFILRFKRFEFRPQNSVARAITRRRDLMAVELAIYLEKKTR